MSETAKTAKSAKKILPDDIYTEVKDLKKGEYYYLTFDFWGYGNTKVKFVKFVKNNGLEWALVRSENGEEFMVHKNAKIFKYPLVL